MHTRITRGWTVLAACLLAACVFVGRAAAQGQTFPPPISTEALERSLGRYAKPTPEARAAIETAHDRYLEAYRRLQDAELEAFAKERPPMLTGGDMSDWIRRFVALRGRILGLDGTLFESIRQALPEERRPGVERIRWVRESEVLRTGFLGDMGGAIRGASRVDLSDLVYSVDLDASDLQRVDPILGEYEQRHLAVIRKSVAEVERLLGEFGDRLKKEGIWGAAFEEAQKDPEKGMELFRRMSGIIKDIFGGVMLEGAKVGDSTRKGYMAVRDALSWDGRYRLVSAWLQGAYPQYARQFPQTLPQVAQSAKRLLGEGSPGAQSIDSILTETMSRAIAAVDAACSAEDEMQVEMMMSQFSMMDEGGMEARQAMTERQQAQRESFTTQIAKISESGLEAIRAQLPPELAEKLKDESAVHASAAMGAAPPVAAADAGEGEGDPAEEVEVPPSMQPTEMSVDMVAHQLKPYGVANLQQFLTAVGATDAQRTTASALHGDYLAKYAEQLETKRKAYDEIRARIYIPQEDGAARADPAKMEQSAAMLKDLVASARAVDDEFFASLAAMVGAANADAVRVERLGRLTGTVGCVSARTWMYAPNAEQAVDLVAVVRSGEMSDAERRAANSALAASASSIETAVLQALDAAIDSQSRIERLQGELFKPNASTDDQVRAAGEWQRRSAEIMSAAKKAGEARAAANQAALDAVLAAVQEETRNDLHRRWSQAGYPTVFHDPGAHFATFRRVERLPTLTPEQSAQVQAALEEYRTAYDIACDAMLAASLKPMPEMKDGQMGTEYWMAIQDRERTIARMRFERDETSARAASKLRQILTPEQLKEFRTLADPSKTKAGGARPW